MSQLLLGYVLTNGSLLVCSMLTKFRTWSTDLAVRECMWDIGEVVGGLLGYTGFRMVIVEPLMSMNGDLGGILRVCTTVSLFLLMCGPNMSIYWSLMLPVWI